MTQLSKVKQNIHTHKDKSFNQKKLKNTNSRPNRAVWTVFVNCAHWKGSTLAKYKTVLIIFPLNLQTRITFRLCVLTHRCLKGSAPAYLAENIRLTADVERRRHLRSSTTTKLVVPPVQRSTLRDRAFPLAAPCAWNSLPPSLRTVSSLVPSRHRL